MKVVHLGDLGRLLDRDVIAQIGKTDVLMLPVGGFLHHRRGSSDQVMNGIRPSIAIPMHFKTEKVEFPVAGTDEFTRGKERVRRIDGHEIEVAKESLPGEPEIIVLRYAN